MKKTYKSIIFQIVFIIIFISIITGLYIICGKQNVSQIMESTENAYKEKMEMPALSSGIKPVKIPDYSRYSYKYAYTINVAGRIKRVIFKLPIPYNDNEKQYITEYTFSMKPSRIYNEKNNTIAEFHLDNLNNQSFVIELSGLAKVRTYDYSTASIINTKQKSEKDLSKYLAAEPLIESNAPIIKSVARKIKGKTQEEIVNNIYEYVSKNIHYTPIPGNIGAKKALEIRKGKCSEFSALMVALCRAKKIPARIVVGQIARDRDTKHNWVEVYYNKYGWVTYDPTERPTIVTTYNQNGEIVKKENKINSQKIHANFIASGVNQFTPWLISYSVSEQANGTATVDEQFEIKKL